MASCSVPKCISKRSTPGISFHEFPCNLEDCDKWIQAISRKNWTPNFHSNSSRVCSRHFLDTDFIPDSKKRRLKRGVVPSIFEYFLSPEQTMFKKPSKRKVKEFDNKYVPLVCIAATSTEAAVHNGIDMELGDYIIEAEVIQNSDNLATKSSSIYDKSLQADCKVLFDPERRQWIKKTEDQRKRIESLELDVDKYRVELQKLKEDCLVKNIEKLVQAANENDVTACFIVDQVKNFNSYRPTWSETTIRQSIKLKMLSTKAYEHLRNEKLLTLPSRMALSKYTGTSSIDTGISPLVEMRLKTKLDNFPTPQKENKLP